MLVFQTQSVMWEIMMQMLQKSNTKFKVNWGVYFNKIFCMLPRLADLYDHDQDEFLFIYLQHKLFFFSINLQLHYVMMQIKFDAHPMKSTHLIISFK